MGLQTHAREHVRRKPRRHRKQAHVHQGARRKRHLPLPDFQEQFEPPLPYGGLLRDRPGARHARRLRPSGRKGPQTRAPHHPGRSVQPLFPRVLPVQQPHGTRARFPLRRLVPREGLAAQRLLGQAELRMLVELPRAPEIQYRLCGSARIPFLRRRILDKARH